MMRPLLIAALALFGAALLTGAGPYEYPPDMRKILQQGRLIVAMCAQDRPPFVSTGADGTLSGVDVELARSIGENLGVPVEINRNAATYDGVIDIVAKGEADIGISLLSATTERARRVLFSEPYLFVRPSLLVNRRKEIERKRTVAATARLQRSEGPIGVMRGSAYEGYVRDFFPEAQVKTYSDWEGLKRAVFRGDVSAILQSGAVLDQMIMEEPSIYLTHRLVPFEGKEDRFACALPVSSSHFLTWVNLLIAQRGKSSHQYIEEAMIRKWNLEER